MLHCHNPTSDPQTQPEPDYKTPRYLPINPLIPSIITSQHSISPSSALLFFFQFFTTYSNYNHILVFPPLPTASGHFLNLSQLLFCFTLLSSCVACIFPNNRPLPPFPQLLLLNTLVTPPLAHTHQRQRALPLIFSLDQAILVRESFSVLLLLGFSTCWSRNTAFPNMS